MEIIKLILKLKCFWYFKNKVAFDNNLMETKSIKDERFALIISLWLFLQVSRYKGAFQMSVHITYHRNKEKERVSSLLTWLWLPGSLQMDFELK